MKTTPNAPILFGCVSGMFLGILVAGASGFRVNTTPSVPLGIYRYTDRSDAPFAAICPTGLAEKLSVERGYRPIGHGCPDGRVPMLKPVTARPGDTITVTAHAVFLNHCLLKNSTIYSFDGHKRPMPHLAQGDYAVQPGTFWSISSYNPQSFDSRYFGAISQKEVVSHAVPVFLF